MHKGGFLPTPAKSALDFMGAKDQNLNRAPNERFQSGAFQLKCRPGERRFPIFNKFNTTPQ